MNGHIKFFSQGRNFRQRGVVYRVGRMGREGGLDQRMAAIAVMYRLTVGKVLTRATRPGGGEANHNHADHRANAGFGGGGGGFIRKEIHIVEAGRAASQHFCGGEPAAVAHELAVGPARLGGPDVFFQPGFKRQVIRNAAQ